MKPLRSLKSTPNAISVIGLGYVGLPLCVEFAKQFSTTGYDINTHKINLLKQKIDPISELGPDDLATCTATFTDTDEDLQASIIKIITVPTPIRSDNAPDLSLVKAASELVAKNLKEGDIVVYESTVYPGVTEDICVPILESISGLTFNQDFFVGYSPERLSPGEKNRTITKITKIVSGSTPEVCQLLADVYGAIIPAGIYPAKTIKVAEAAKVVENVQRDLNVALMNELAIIFEKMSINTLDVVEAAATKWNFMKMTPGLVGGHCIGVDPYYLTYKAEQLGYHPQVILSGRRINNGMGKFVGEQVVKLLIQANKPVRNAKVGILGITFKENVADIRNSKVIDVINELKSYNTEVIITDPHASPKEVQDEYGLSLTPFEDIKELDALILAVPHEAYRNLTANQLLDTIKSKKVFFDIKGVFRDSPNINSLCSYRML